MLDTRIRTRLSYTLFAAQSLFSAAQIAVITMVAIMATELSGTESAAGLPSSTTTFAQAFAAYPLGLLMGRFGRRFGLSLGYGAGALGALVGIVAILLGSFPLLLISAALMGMGRASSDQSRFAAGEMYPEDQRARMIGRIVFAGTIGAITGPLLVSPGARLLQSLGLDPNLGAWSVAFCLYVLALVITVILLHPDPMSIAHSITTGEEAARSDDRPPRPLRQLLMLPSVQLAILAMLISQTVMVVLMVMTPLHMHHNHHHQDSVSLVISVHTLGMFGLSAFTGYLIDRFGRITMLVVGALILIASALLAPLSADVTVLAVALFLLGLGWNFGYVAGSSLLSDALQGAEKARVQGVNETLVAFVAGLGSLGAGPLFASGGYFAVSMAGMLMTLLLIGFIYRLSRPAVNVNTASVS